MNQLVVAQARRSTIPTPTAALQTALRLFEEELSREQKLYLHQSGRGSDPSDVVVFIAEIDAANQSSRRSSSSRLFTFLDTAQQFVNVVDTFVSANPSVAALVWGSIKTSIVVANNNLPFFERVTAMITAIGQWSPTYAQFNRLYQDNPEVQTALCEYYTIIIRICTKIVQVHSHSGDLLSRLLTSFEMNFKPLLDELERSQKQLHLHFHLAAQQILSESAQIVSKDSVMNKVHRRLVSSFHASSLRKQTKLSESVSLQYRQQILDNLSKIKPRQTWSAVHAQRVNGTAEWFKQDASYNAWLQTVQSSVLCCSGTLGVGKSVLVSCIIACLERARNIKHRISYHFCQANYADTLSARAVLGSVARQLLAHSVHNLGPSHLPGLLEKSQDATTKDVMAMLECYLEQGIDHPYFIILDGLDECSEPDVVKILSQVKQLSDNQRFCIKTLYSCRPDMEAVMSRCIKYDMRFEVNCHNLQEDIQKYIEVTVEQHVNEGRLKIRDPSLLFKVVEVLTTECDSMFLWLSLFLEELCFQDTDADILETLKRPPKGITELYNRKIHRIRSSKSVAKSMAILRYTGVALRPLSIEEMRLALSVRFDQREFDSSRLPTDMGRVIRVCGGLIHVDEGTTALQYVHSSLPTYLFMGSQTVEGFCYSEAQIEFSSLCMTFLNFKNFTRQLSQVPKDKHEFKPIDSALAQVWPSTALNPRLAQRLLQFRNSRAAIDSQKFSSLLPQSPTEPTRLTVFFEYASEHWLQHTKDLGTTEDEYFWHVFRSCVTNHDLDKWKPWLNVGGEQSYNTDANRMAEWALSNKHTTLLFYQIDRDLDLDRKTNTTNVELLWRIILGSNLAAREHVVFLTAVVQHLLKSADGKRVVSYGLLAAASGDRLGSVGLLLDAGADVVFWTHE